MTQLTSRRWLKLHQSFELRTTPYFSVIRYGEEMVKYIKKLYEKVRVGILANKFKTTKCKPTNAENLQFFFFFLESFNLQHPLLMIALYYHTKTPIGFWCRWGLNPKSLI